MISWLAQYWARIGQPTDKHQPTIQPNANVGPTLSSYLGSLPGSKRKQPPPACQVRLGLSSVVCRPRCVQFPGTVYIYNQGPLSSKLVMRIDNPSTKKNSTSPKPTCMRSGNPKLCIFLILFLFVDLVFVLYVAVDIRTISEFLSK